MKVSEMIAHLEEFQKQHGDIALKLYDNIYQEFFPVRETAFREAIEDVEAFGEIV